ncbi:MAG: hypothetical protein WCI29_10060 [Actinomycetes bacterium]
MSPPTRGQRWKLHLTLGFGLSICVVGFTVELTRGLGGHLPAWVYVLEWPTFAIAGVIIWRRLLTDDDEPSETKQAAQFAEESARALQAANDPELARWNAYVAKIETAESEPHE